MDYTIKNIKNFKKFSKIVFENNVSLNINKDTISTLYLYKGKTLDSQSYEKLLEISNKEDLLDYIYKKINNKEYSIKKIEEYLKKKGANKKQISNIVSFLKKTKILDDNKIVRNYFIYCNNKHIGYNKMINNLRMNGIPEKILLRINYDENREKINAKKLLFENIDKYKNKNHNKQKSLMFDFLVRNGFDPLLVSELVTKYVLYDKNKEQNVLKLEYNKFIKKYFSKYSSEELKNIAKKYLLNKGFRLNDIIELENTYEMDKRIN